MRFEKFFLIDSKEKNHFLLKFCHCENGKEIKVSTEETVKILQTAEIQCQTKFSTKNLISRYAKYKYKNMKDMKLGDPVNVYFIPVEYKKELNGYIPVFYSPEE